MIGVVADDITGSNDIGIMFSKSGYISDIYNYGENTLTHISEQKPHVYIFNTDSRLLDENNAYQLVYQATKDIQQAGATQFFNKTCSVFRGNIGAEFDAMLDALGEEFAVIVLGFPANGRQTINSIHYVHGKKLEESQFKHDPVHPMTNSNLVDILQAQTKRKVGAITHEIIKQGRHAIKQALEQMKTDVNYVILDVTDQNDLHEIAHAVIDEKIICGSSALAEEIPKVKPRKKLATNSTSLPKYQKDKGLFCSAGSLTPQTYEQIEYMKNTNTKILELNTLDLITNEDQTSIINELITQAIEYIHQGINVIVHTTNDPAKVEQTKQAGLKRGFKNMEISQLISDTIAKITYQVVTETKQNRFVVAGGETSGAVCKAFRIKGMRVWKEIQTGLPSCVSLTDPAYLFVLKSGSFGTPDFIEQAFQHLETETS